MDFSDAQIDWIGFEEEGIQLAALIRQSVERIGVCEVAKHLEETPSALRNQIAGRRALPPGTWSVCWRLDAAFRSACAGVKKEVLARPPDLSPEEALREAYVKAQARGYIDARDVAVLYARARKDAP